MRTGDEYELPESNCLACGTRLNAATGIGNGDNDDWVPHPGVVTVCIKCGHVMAFDHDLTLRELNKEEAQRVAGDKRILAIQKARATLKDKLQ